MAKPQFKNNPVPTHIPIVFTCRTFMRRNHVQGSPQPQEGENPLMILCDKGEKYLIDYTEALQLIVAETGIKADEPKNAEWIAYVKQEARADKEREARTSKEAPKHESLDEKILRIVTAALGIKQKAA